MSKQTELEELQEELEDMSALVSILEDELETKTDDLEVSDELWQEDQRKLERAEAALRDVVDDGDRRVLRPGYAVAAAARDYFAAQLAREDRRREHDTEFHS